MKKVFFALLFVGFFVSCSDDEPNDPIFIPQCIDDIIPSFAQDACPGSGDLTTWLFDGQEVYCFNEGGCYTNPRALIYAENCALICVLGGNDENTICDGLVWEDNADFLNTVYYY